MIFKYHFTEISNEYKALADVYANIHSDNLKTVILFLSSNYNLEMTAIGIKKLFSNINVLVFTSSNLIFNKKLSHNGIIAIGLGYPNFESELIYINNLSNFPLNYADLLSINIKNKYSDFYKNPDKYIGLFIQDNKNYTINNFYYWLQEYLKPIKIFSFLPYLENNNYYFFNGNTFVNSGSILFLIKSEKPIIPFNFNNFLCSDSYYIVTRSDTKKNEVLELNFQQAASVYSAALSLEVSKLSNNIFFNNPFIIKKGNVYRPIVIQDYNPSNLTLKLYEPIKEGTVFRIGIKSDIINNLKDNLTQLKEKHGSMSFILTFDSIFRAFSFSNSNALSNYLSILDEFNCFGINTIAETQFGINFYNTFLGFGFLE